MSTPNSVLTEDHSWSHGPYDQISLGAGAFVRPIEFIYVPKHVLDKPLCKGFNKDKEIFCYTSYGILPVPYSKIRRV